MKNYGKFVCAALALALGTVASAEDYQLLRAKAELLVNQASELFADSCNKGSELHAPQFQYYLGLMMSSGTNLMARAKSQTTERRLRQYCELAGKDYEAYTKVVAATEMASATGSQRGKSGARHRVKRIINAEKIGDKELALAIKRWETFIAQIGKDPKPVVRPKPAASVNAASAKSK